MRFRRIFGFAELSVLSLGFLFSGVLVLIIYRLNGQLDHHGLVSQPRADAVTTLLTDSDEPETNFSDRRPVKDEFYVRPGLALPATTVAGEAFIPEKEMVIGIVAGTRARAYRLRIMKDPDRHILNDLVDGVPISVVYCNLTDCITAYTSSKTTDRLLDLNLGGWHNGQLVLKIDDRLFYQGSGKPLPPGAFDKLAVNGVTADLDTPFPYRSYPFVRTFWKKWKTAHPQTDVYWING
ncbi:MAG: DUF3179 domain-containing (seleno)protein [Gemmataceae bacterium]